MAFDWVYELQHHLRGSQKPSNTFISNTNGKPFRFHFFLAELGNFYTQRDGVLHNCTTFFGSVVLKTNQELWANSGQTLGISAQKSRHEVTTLCLNSLSQESTPTESSYQQWKPGKGTLHQWDVKTEEIKCQYWLAQRTDWEDKSRGKTSNCLSAFSKKKEKKERKQLLFKTQVIEKKT